MPGCGVDKPPVLWYSFDSFCCICFTVSLVLMSSKDEFCGLLRGLIWDLNSFDPLKGAARKEFLIGFYRHRVCLRRMMCK